MNYLRQTIRLFHNTDVKVLGRWAINYDSAQIKTKVHQANHDHCGVCDVRHTRLVTSANSAASTDISESKYLKMVKMKVLERQSEKK
jgi:hypothetical protein